jgi:hypothetical protein
VRGGLQAGSGVFAFGNVPPGNYYVVGFDHTDDRGVPLDTLLSTIISIASSVRVETGTTASVDLG